ncbi:putative isomerase YbhE [Panus rudis PR-1116 ss-1]|nr:putative isomerase YbhE [Panus rudis PR-1116 ss-1]
MVNFLILAGGYTNFITSYLFNSTSSTLTLLNQSPSGTNPSWIASHPTNKSILYAVNENTPGQLQSFLVDTSGVITNVANASSGGDGPAFANPLSTGEVAIMNFGTGDGSFIATAEDPLQFGDSSFIKFPTPSKAAPNNISRPHMALEYGSEVLVPDLNGDTIWRLAKDNTTGQYTIQGQLQQPENSGPRHIAVKDKTLYTIHETDSTLTQQDIPDDPSAPSSIIATFNITPPNPPPQAQFAGAEIRLLDSSASFPGTFIYASNRNIGPNPDPQGDAIAIYKVDVAPDTGVQTVTFVKYVFTGLQQIRGMEFGGDENEFLVAAGFAGEAGTMVFQRVDGGADLKMVAQNTDIPTRTSFVWVDA